MSTYYDFMVEAKYKDKWYNIDLHTKDFDGKLRHQYFATFSRSFVGQLESLIDGAWRIGFDDLAESTQNLLLSSIPAECEDILGDMAMRGRNETLIALVAQLKGRKILFRGNHDDLSDYRYQKLFADITDYREISESFDGQSYKLCLMHYPILMWNGQHRGSILLYAHTHNTVEEAFFQKCVKELNENKKLNVQQGKPIRAINVGCMMPYMNYEPRTLKEILSAQNARKE